MEKREWYYKFITAVVTRLRREINKLVINIQDMGLMEPVKPYNKG